MGMDISFIIVHYNAVALLHNCVRSILEHTQGLKYEIIVVDNASSDRSIEQFPNAFENAPIQLVLLNQNKGFGAGNNAAYKIAKGKYLFLLNPDTLLCSNAAFQFFQFMEQPDAKITFDKIKNKNKHNTKAMFNKHYIGIYCFNYLLFFFKICRLSNNCFNSINDSFGKYFNLKNIHFKMANCQ